MIIYGPFGSGKTILLKDKAIEVAKHLKKIGATEEKTGKFQNHALENVHFMVLRQIHNGSITETNKVEKNIQTHWLEKELGTFGIKVNFFWTIIELFEYIEEQPTSDNFFLDEFSLGFLSKVKQD